LDPFATGLLVLLSGAATRLVPCFVGLDKRYLTDVDLTSTTTTGDPEGEVVERHAPPSRAALDEALARLHGQIELPVPAASAVKIGGERAYRLARRGVEVDMPLRRSQVHALDVIAYTGDAPAAGSTTSASDAVAAVRLELRVSSGTYIRSIAHALGGHCTTLRRLTVGDFGVDEAAPVAEAALLSVGAALERLPPEAREKVSESVRAGVLALDAPVGDGSAA
jgi:tRNA pseudouridine55 synthase